MHYSSTGQKNKHLRKREDKGNICDLTNQKTEVDLDGTNRTLHITTWKPYKGKQTWKTGEKMEG